eukprot:3382612-Prymnesium_polylepis.1
MTPTTGRQIGDDRRDPVSHVVDVRQRRGTLRAAGDHSRPPPSAILAPVGTMRYACCTSPCMYRL